MCSKEQHRDVPAANVIFRSLTHAISNKSLESYELFNYGFLFHAVYLVVISVDRCGVLLQNVTRINTPVYMLYFTVGLFVNTDLSWNGVFRHEAAGFVAGSNRVRSPRM